MRNEFKLYEHAANIPEDKNNPSEKSSEYPNLTEAGVEKAREEALKLLEEIKDAAPGTVVWLGGNSYIPRSRDTIKIISSVIEDSYKDDSSNDILFFSQEKLKELADGLPKAEEGKTPEKGYRHVVSEIVQTADQHPDAKVVIDLPLWIKQFSDKNWYVMEGRLKDYQDQLCKDFDLFTEYGENYAQATKKWFEHPDTAPQDERTPEPLEVAKSYLQGLSRLADFTRKYANDRPVKIVVVGHSLEINALLTYLANDGAVTKEGFDRVGGTTINFAESATIEFHNDTINTTYRGHEYTFTTPKSSTTEES